MSDTMIDAGSSRQVPVSRRSAIRTGALAVLTAGLLGPAATSAPAAAEPIALPSALTPVISTDDLAADVRELYAEYAAYREQRRVAEDALNATLTLEQRRLYVEASDALSNGTSVWHEAVNAEMARHVPGLAPIIRLLWLHAIGTDLAYFGECCTSETGYEL